MRRYNEGDFLTDVEKQQMDYLSKVWDFLFTGMWKTRPTKEYEAAIEKQIMAQMKIEYATHPENNREHYCCRKIVNRLKNVVRKKILDTGKRMDVHYRRQGMLFLI